MNSRWWLNLGLAVFIVVLLVAVHYAPGRDPGDLRPPLTALTADGVQHIRVMRPGHASIELARQGSGWQMLAPTHARADRFRIDDLLHLVRARVQDSFVPVPSALASYGLNPPQATVWFNNERLDFGNSHTLNHLQYVLYKGRVDLISAYSMDPASLRTSDLYSARLLEKGEKLVALKLPHFSLASHHGVWQVTPPNSQLSTDTINGFVDEWRYARALSVDRYSGKPVTGHVFVTYVNPAPGVQDTRHTLDIGIIERSPELVLYRKDEGLEYHLPMEVGAHLLNLSATP